MRATLAFNGLNTFTLFATGGTNNSEIGLENDV